MDLAFADSVQPASQTILRLPMLPYSIGHELRLLQQRNPLLLPESDFDSLLAKDQRLAIIRAALVCSQTWQQNQKLHRWLNLWGWLIRNSDFALAIAEFRNYRHAGTTMPTLAEPDEKGREMGSPHTARILHFALSLYGLDAYDAPLGQLQWMYFSAAEAQGNCKVENSTERQIRDEVAQHRADYEREQKEKQCPV